MILPSIPLGSYELHAVCGRGAGGEVWRGVHRDQGVPVAVKVLAPDAVADPLRWELLRNEARQVARLDHPAIVLLLDMGDVDARAEQDSRGRLVAGSPWLAMELAGGGSLAGPSGHRDWAWVRDLLESLLAALAHAHARGVLHRDIKPGNVLLCTAGDLRPGPKLSDFGLAGPGGQRPSGGGTPGFVAPEQVRGTWRQQGPWTDLYALGCLAWWLVTGRAPFDHPDPARVARAHLEGVLPDLQPLFDVPDGLEAWLHRCLLREPDQRFRWAAEALAGLRELGEPRPSVSPEHVLAAGRDTTLAEVSAAGSIVPHPLPALVVPDHWRDATPQGPAVRLAGAGLGLYGLRTVSLVGQEPQRDALWEALRRVLAGDRPRGVLLEGPAGTGRTRLAGWLGSRAHELGLAQVVTVVHQPVPGPGHGPIPALCEALSIGGLDPVNSASALDDPPALAALAGRERDASAPRAAFTPLLARVAGDRAVVLVLDDLEWGPEAVGWARHLLTHAHREALRVLVVGVTRPGAGIAQDLASLATVETVRLEPLEDAQLDDLLGRLVGLAPDLARAVRERSQGTPLYATQLVGDWVRRGVLVPGPEGFSLPPGEDRGLPADLRQLWSQRLDAAVPDQDSGARRCCQAAAVLGGSVDRGELAAVLEHAGEPAAADLEALLQHEGLAVPERAGWRFVHTLLREVLIEEAREAGRLVNLHRACAEVLRAEPERQGRHLAAAGDWTASLAPLLVGLEAVLDGDHPVRARELLDLLEEAAAAVALPPSDLRRGQLALARARLALRAGTFDDADRRARRVVSEARRHRWQGLLPRALRYRGMAAQRLGDPSAAEAMLLQARATAASEGDPREQVRAAVQLASLARLRGQLDEGAAGIEAVLGLALGLDDLATRADCLAELGIIRLAQSDLEGGIALLEEALETHTAARSAFGVAYCRNSLADALRLAGRLEEATAAYGSARDDLDRLGDEARVFPAANLGLVLLARDEHEAAEQAFAATLEDCRRTGRRGLEPYLQLGLAACAGQRRDAAAFDEHLAEAEGGVAEAEAVDRDLAWTAERAAVASRVWDEERSRRAAELALSQYEALGEEDSVARLRGLLRPPG